MLVKYLFVIIILSIITFLISACTPVEDSIEGTIPLAINPSKTTLNSGDQVIISITSDQWATAELNWIIPPNSGELEQLDDLTVLYTAPLERTGVVTVSVQGSNNTGVKGTASLIFNIQPPEAVVVVDGLNLREGPGTEYNVIGWLLNDESLDIQGRNANSDWIQVQPENDPLGWVSADLVQINIDLETVPITNVLPTASIPTSRPLGIFNDFESEFTVWTSTGHDEGTFESSTEQAYKSVNSGKLTYNFPLDTNNIVRFEALYPLALETNQITAWVYGDGFHHFLTVLIKDNTNEIWRFPFGRVSHRGWRQMTANLDESLLRFRSDRKWVNPTLLENRVDGDLDYPITFLGLEFIDESNEFQGSGAIFIDDLATVHVTPTATPSYNIQFYADHPALDEDLCTTLYWDVDNVDAVYSYEYYKGVTSEDNTIGWAMVLVEQAK